MITIDHENHKFCPGPCNNMENEDITKSMFKPYSGGRYKNIVYPLPDNKELVITNLRICRGCIDRYHDFYDEDHYEGLIEDSILIMKKMIKLKVASDEVKTYINNITYIYNKND